MGRDRAGTRIWAGVLAALLLAGLFSGCAGRGTQAADETRAPLEQANYGVMTGSTAEIFLQRTYPQAKISTFSAIADAFLALDGGKTDYVLTAYTTALNAVRSNPNLEIYQRDVIEEESSIAVSKANPELRAAIDGVLDRFKADGTLEQVVANWTTEGADYVLADLPRSDGANGVLRVAIAADREPMCFVMDGAYRGLDCELIERIAYELGRTVEYQNMSFGSLVAALSSGKADVIISNMTATGERRESVDFTQSYFANPQVLVARRTGAGPDPAAARYAVTSVVAQDVLSERYPQAGIDLYPAAADAFAALKGGKADFVMTSRATAGYMMKQDPANVIYEDGVTDEACSIAVARSQGALCAALDDALDRMEADGTLAELTARWSGADPDHYGRVDVPGAAGANGTLRVAVSPDVPPICFVLDGEPAGIDVELVERLALILDKKVEWITMEFDALLPALESGKADIALSDLNATPERRVLADFTRPYYDNPQVLVTRSGAAQAQGGFLEGLRASFVRTFVTEGRWKLILSGLWVTVLISVCSGVCGALLGFFLCLLRRSRHGAVGGLTAAFIRVIQGTPIVVLLMILYYVVFGGIDIPALLVSILGFSVNFAVYVSEMMRTGIDSVDPGQIEAAVALGYTRPQTFLKITFPQAARHFLPVFKGEFISMVKMTSVVGYIALQDLTKVSDIIRSRTLEAFFPLIATAVLYFLISNLLILALSLVEVRLDPKRRKRVLKGAAAQ